MGRRDRAAPRHLGRGAQHLPYELLFQLPFAVAAIAVMLVARQIGQAGPIRAMLVGIFGVIAAHFLLKPFLVVSLGSGPTPKSYLGSVYAVVSQISTGVLLVAAGLCLLLLVIQKALDETILDAETDPLTGLTNRRGLYRVGPRLLVEATLRGRGFMPCSSISITSRRSTTAMVMRPATACWSPLRGCCRIWSPRTCWRCAWG